LEYLSGESKLIIECGMFARFRQVLLSNFLIVSDQKSLQRLLIALYKTARQEPLTIKDILSNGVMDAIYKFVEKGKINIMLSRLNLHKLLINSNVKVNNCL
jgi:hypothetical protein